MNLLSAKINFPNGEDDTKMEENKKAIYKNVLTFPQGAEYLKYFERNPHPDKIDDSLLAISEALGKPDLNVNFYQKMLDFTAVRKFLEPKLSEREKLMFRLPEKMQKMIDFATNSEEIIAYTHLRDCFLTYLSIPKDTRYKPDIHWIDYDFATKCDPSQRVLADLQNNLFNDKAMAKLVEKLFEAGAFTDRRSEFYFWNTSPYNWPEISYQARSTVLGDWKKHFNDFYNPPLQYAALGNFSINALPEGYVQPKGNGKYDICVNKMYFFINDVFNFEGEDPLGVWELENPTGGNLLASPVVGTSLWNSDFRSVQRHGYGQYFPVLSRLHELEDFQPVCREYQHVK